MKIQNDNIGNWERWWKLGHHNADDNRHGDNADNGDDVDVDDNSDNDSMTVFFLLFFAFLF